MLPEEHFFQAPFYDGLLCFHDLLSRLISNADASDARPSFNHRGNDPIMPLPELHIMRQRESHAIAFLDKQRFGAIWAFWKTCFSLFRRRRKRGLPAFSVMRNRVLAWLLLAAFGLPLASQSAEVLDSSVKQQHGRYMMHSESVVQAPVPKVRALLMDYENFLRLNPDVKRVEFMKRLDDGGTRMGVSMGFCISAVCLNFDWVQDVRLLPGGDIAATIVPNRGDFRQGNSRWRLLANGGGTRLIFDADLTPNDWFPPLIGSWMMKQKLYEEASEIAHGLERMAISNCC